MTLTQLREKLKADRAKLADLRGKASADGASAEDRSAYGAAVQACRETLDLIKVAEEEERIDAASSKAADAPVSGENGGEGERRPYAQPEVKLDKDQRIAMVAAAAAKSALLRREGEASSPLKLLSDEGFPQFAKDLDLGIRARGKAVTSNQNSGVLLPAPVTGDIIPFLYPETTFLQGGPRRVRLVGGKYRQPRGAQSATASYVGEGQKKPVGQPAFDDINMQAKKLAGIVLLTDEARKWPVADIEAYIRLDLRRALGLKMDSAAYFGTGLSNAPLGIFNRPGITIIDASAGGLFADAKAPTVAELDATASRMIMALTGANIPMSPRWRWTMGYRFMHYLSNLRDGNGNRIYPEIDRGEWKGIKILVSNQFPENGGVTTDETSLGLVDFGHVLYGDEEDVIVKTSTEATIDDGGTLVHLYQQNMMAILMEMEHDFALDQAKAVVLLTKFRAGAP